MPIWSTWRIRSLAHVRWSLTIAQEIALPG